MTILQEPSRRFINLYVSRVVAFSPQNRLVEDNPSSLSLMDIYRQRCQAKHLEPDTPITRYYERLAGVQARGAQASHQVSQFILSFDIYLDTEYQVKFYYKIILISTQGVFLTLVESLCAIAKTNL